MIFRMKNSKIQPESDSQKLPRNFQQKWEHKNKPKHTAQNNNTKILLVITYLYGIGPMVMRVIGQFPCFFKVILYNFKDDRQKN
jgi:hypothetical protein